MYVIKDIVIEKVVEKILMNVSFLMYYGDLMYFIIYIEEFGIDICLILDFQDLYVMFMGELCCRFLLLFFNNKFFELNFNQIKVEFIYEYDDMGLYFVKFLVYNIVLKKVVSVFVNIIISLCNIFIVKIVGEDFKDLLDKI